MIKTIGKFLREWAVVFGTVAAVLLFSTYVGNAAYIPSSSMVPTLHVHDVVGVDKLVKPSGLQRGDIVVFFPNLEQYKGERFIKRLIGIGGDTIEIKEGTLYRNGQAVSEPYLNEKMNYTYGPITVPQGKFFFLGDNRNDSLDSHLWPDPFLGPDAIVGKAIVKLYPFNDIQGM
jgi:signal peptidase I